MAEVRLQLAREESEIQAQDASPAVVFSVHDMSPGQFISSGLELEEQQ